MFLFENWRILTATYLVLTVLAGIKLATALFCKECSEIQPGDDCDKPKSGVKGKCRLDLNMCISGTFMYGGRWYGCETGCYKSLKDCKECSTDMCNLWNLSTRIKPCSWILLSFALIHLVLD